MIRGTIVDLQAKITVILRLSQGQEVEIACVIDTEFVVNIYHFLKTAGDFGDGEDLGALGIN
jgi:hypothetical protein